MKNFLTTVTALVLALLATSANATLAQQGDAGVRSFAYSASAEYKNGTKVAGTTTLHVDTRGGWAFNRTALAQAVVELAKAGCTNSVSSEQIGQTFLAGQPLLTKEEDGSYTLRLDGKTFRVTCQP